MKYSGLYHIPIAHNTPEASTTVLNALIHSIETKFDLAVRQLPWSLTHRLLRSVPPPTAQSPLPQSYQHILQLSYLNPSQTYCYIHPFSAIHPSHPANPQIKPDPSPSTTQQPQASAAPGTIISIPVSQSEAHIGFLVNQLSPLWAFRHALNVVNGPAYATGQFVIHLGDLRASRPGSASVTSTSGIVVCISTAIEDDDDDDDDLRDSGYMSLDGEVEEEIDLGEAQAQIRALWIMLKEGVEFGKAEPREYMMSKELVKGEREKEAVVRMWCELLRLRS
ncbi:hypothetical protein CC78DRAFT_611766 [Lojkania enalia]|uniref:Mediator of RNA polymerase II transcription subunit 20 n=1 Tax=Lojkania enalia TaxID=147567 RepID=A0A9P4NBA6_9PLEO|nr:hypothetical protein CC78DRAFT_611766 [Didymosphaeria enalia]